MRQRDEVGVRDEPTSQPVSQAAVWAPEEAEQGFEIDSSAETTSTEHGRVKLTVNIPEREMATLRRIADRRDLSLTDVIRRAIAMEKFIEDVDRQGGKLLVEQPDHTIRQLVLR